MLHIANQGSRQGNARPAEDSGMTPTIDRPPPATSSFMEVPEVKQHKETTNLWGFPIFVFAFPNLLFFSSSVSLEELYSTIFNERRHLLALP